MIARLAPLVRQPEHHHRVNKADICLPIDHHSGEPPDRVHIDWNRAANELAR